MKNNYDKEQLIERIMQIFDPKFTNNNKYKALQNLINTDIDKMELKKTNLEKLIVALQDDYLLLTYDVQTNITNEGHDDHGTMWVDLSVSIDDAATFYAWIKTINNSQSIHDQNDLEHFLQTYLKTNTVNFNEVGLTVRIYDVN